MAALEAGRSMCIQTSQGTPVRTELFDSLRLCPLPSPLPFPPPPSHLPAIPYTNSRPLPFQSPALLPQASRPFSAHLPPENPDNDRPWPEPPRHTGLRDAWALWLFLLLLAVLLCLGLAYGLPRLGVWEKALLDEGEDWARYNDLTST
jgi:hypothetical protein